MGAMMEIIICEDDLSQRKKIEKIIIEEASASKYDLKIVLSASKPNEVIDYITISNKSGFIYFLDVELNDSINGIELAKIIRMYDPKGYIVFITSHAELTLLTFEYKVQALDYILKFDTKNLQAKIIECLSVVNNANQKINSIEKKYISIDGGNRIINLNIEDIIFFETYKDHRIRVHTLDEIIEFYGSLKEIAEMLPSYFYKSHRSYIVNINYIKEIDKKTGIMDMKNGEKCYISKRYMKEIIANVLYNL